MTNIKDDKYYSEKVLEHIEKVDAYVGNKSYEEFISNQSVVDATMFRLIQVVENIKRLTMEFKASMPNINWANITGFRNRIVHEYGETDYKVVYSVATVDCAQLKLELSLL